MDRQHEETKGEAHSESGSWQSGPSADSPRTKSGGRDLTHELEALLADLRHETYALGACHHEQCPDQHYRRGWNDRGESVAKRIAALLAGERLRVALLELRASDVDFVECKP